jgi:hypothetical protein
MFMCNRPDADAHDVFWEQLTHQVLKHLS